MKRRVLFGALVGIALALLVVCVPKLYRCYSYRKLLATPTLLDRLEIVPVEIGLPSPPEGSRLFLGYASVVIPEPIESIRVSRTVLIIDCERTKLMFWAPHDPKHELPPNQEADPVQRDLAHEHATQPLEHLRRVLNVTPVSYLDVFFMGSATFKEHALLAWAKGLTARGRSIGEFGNEHIQGFLHVSLFDNKNQSSADVFSGRGGVSQRLFVSADSPDISKEQILSILSSLTYTLETVPPEQELHGLIVSALRAHPRYVPDTDG
jgi:hypothetical protein